MIFNINLKIEDDLEIALKASKKAGDIIMKYYKHDYEINEKGYHNPVTTADKEADSLEKAVQDVLDEGLRTKDIISKGMKEVSTSVMGDAIISKLQ